MILEAMIRAYLSDTLRNVQAVGTIAAKRIVMPGNQSDVYAAGWCDAVQAMATALELVGDQLLLTSMPRELAPSLTMPVRLTKREHAIAQLICEGLTTAQIAERFTLEQSTVKTHRRAISRKVGVSSQAGLTTKRVVWEVEARPSA